MNYRSLLAILSASMLTLSGCAMLSAYDRGLDYLNKAEYQAAYDVLQDEFKKDPTNPHLKEALIKACENLARPYLDEIDSLGEFELNAKRQYLANLQALYPVVVPSIEQRIQETARKSTNVAAYARRVAAGEFGTGISGLMALSYIYKYSLENQDIQAAKESISADRKGLESEIIGQNDAKKALDVAVIYDAIFSDSLSHAFMEALNNRIYNNERKLVTMKYPGYSKMVSDLSVKGYFAIQAEIVRMLKDDDLLVFSKRENDRAQKQMHKAVGSDFRLEFEGFSSENQRKLQAEIVSHAPFLVDYTNKPRFLIKVSLTKLQWGFKNKAEKVAQSTYLAGYNHVPNPAYQSAVDVYNQAVNTYNAQKTQNGRNWSKIAISIAEANLSNTPQVLSQPIFLPYTYLQKPVSETGDIQATVKVVDLATGRILTQTTKQRDHQKEHLLIDRAKQEDAKGIKNVGLPIEESISTFEALRNSVLGMLPEAVLAALGDAYVEKAKLCDRSNLVLESDEYRLRQAHVLRTINIGNNSRQDTAPQLHRSYDSNTWATLNVATSLLPPLFNQVKEAGRLSISTNPLPNDQLVRLTMPSLVFVDTIAGSGSGFLVDNSGRIITNYHVIEGAKVITVRTNDNRFYEATLVNAIPSKDLAILKIEAAGLPYLSFRDAEPRPGETVLALGAPLGLKRSISAGVFSSIRTFNEAFPANEESVYDPNLKLVQADAVINPGNSGGPLIDSFGRVIGVNTLKNIGLDGIGFSVAAEEVKAFYQLTIGIAKE